MSFGENLNKLVIIVDILDQNRVLVDGPSCGLRRQIMNVKRLALTAIKVDGIARGALVPDVKAAYDAADVDGKFAASAWGKKLEKKSKRAALTDYGRHKVMIARMKKGKAVAAELEKLKGSA